MTSQAPRKTEEDPRESTSAPVLVEIPELEDPLVIVSGLPRSGTSLMMSLLAAGGHPILTDQLRTPDPDNPRGYFEYTPVRSLMRDNTWLSAHRGRAIKIISTLLPFIPADLPLKVICMQRHLPEVLASQAAMLSRAGKPQPPDPSLLAAAFQKQITITEAFLAQRPLTRILNIYHHRLLQSPAGEIDRLMAFLPVLRNHLAMLGVIDPTLHRQRQMITTGLNSWTARHASTGGGGRARE